MALALFACAPQPSSSRDERPNVLFLLTDDQAASFLSAAGHPWIETPALDRLAREGVRFDNAFVTTSLCSPSRASFLTGVYAHVHGVRSNARHYPDDLPSFGTLLGEAGYDTAYFGKWHMGDQSGPRPGFAYSVSYVGHGTYHGAELEVDGRKRASEGFVDDVVTDHALEFLEQRRDRPFAAVVGFKAPHRPLSPPDRLAEAFADANIAPPPNADADPPYGDWVRAKERSKRVRLSPYSPDELREYGRLVAAADQNVGRILETLDAEGLTENTVVVFASDNGMMLGAHGLNNKVPAYEESIRIPFLVRFPPLAAAGTVVDEMVLNVDLMPTLLDLTGVARPDHVQGRTLRPLLEGTATSWRDEILYEFEPPADGGIMPAMVALRTRSKKLVVYPGRPEWTELFDLTADPFETTNLAGSPEHGAELEELRARLDAAKTSLGLD